MSDNKFSNSDEKCQCRGGIIVGLWQAMFPCKTKKMRDDEKIVTDFLGSVLFRMIVGLFLVWLILWTVEHAKIIFIYFSKII